MQKHTHQMPFMSQIDSCDTICFGVLATAHLITYRWSSFTVLPRFVYFGRFAFVFIQLSLTKLTKAIRAKERHKMCHNSWNIRRYLTMHIILTQITPLTLTTLFGSRVWLLLCKWSDWLRVQIEVRHLVNMLSDGDLQQLKLDLYASWPNSLRLHLLQVNKCHPLNTTSLFLPLEPKKPRTMPERKKTPSNKTNYSRVHNFFCSLSVVCTVNEPR